MTEETPKVPPFPRDLPKDQRTPWRTLWRAVEHLDPVVDVAAVGRLFRLRVRWRELSELLTVEPADAVLGAALARTAAETRLLEESLGLARRQRRREQLADMIARQRFPRSWLTRPDPDDEDDEDY